MMALFFDPVLRAPILGSMFMGFLAGLVGALVFLQKRSLLGEAIAHATYPGIVLGVLVAFFLFPFSEGRIFFSLFLGAVVSGVMGLISIDRLEKFAKIKSDAALCFVLSLFFGVGVLIASHVQVSHPLWFQQTQVFLFGQAATMVDSHIFLYAALAALALLAIFLFFRRLEIFHFDSSFAKVMGLPVRVMQVVTFGLLVLSIVVGMRTVGVVLMSAMLIAPPSAARQWTSRFVPFFLLSGAFGALSGFLGSSLSESLPTGPMIVLTAAFLSLLSLLIAPQRGVLVRYFRRKRFALLCQQENILKSLVEDLPHSRHRSQLRSMERKGWIVRRGDAVLLTEKGRERGEKLRHLHLLWEAYLIQMGQHEDRVHKSAEEMEHILTPELEKELTQQLGSRSS